MEIRRALSITVDTLDDEVDGGDGFTSLREAIQTANSLPSPDVIDFAPALTQNGAATIELSQGQLEILHPVAIVGPGAGLLTIDASGNDPTELVDNGDGSRVFSITVSTGTTHIGGLSITGGDSGAEKSCVRVF